jgi:hypothetical protein
VIGMETEEPSGLDAANVRFLRWLVTILTVTMIGGVLTIVALLVMRLGGSERVTFPDQIELPDGSTATAFTQGQGWYAVVTGENEVLIYSSTSGALVQRIPITSELTP